MIKKKSILPLIVLVSIIILLNSIYSYDVGYITKKNPDKVIHNIFLKDMNLTVDVIPDKDVRSKNLNSYKFIFIDDGVLKNTQNLPIYKYDSVIMNKNYGPQFGLTDIDGVSQLAANDPLKVKKGSQILQVYTRAMEHNGVSIPYYYLDDENKANMTSIARTYTGDKFDFGDVIAKSSKGQKLINGKYSEGKICFFGISKTDYWTENAKNLFKECVIYVAAECQDNSECNDNDPYTYDYCLNSGKINAECKHDQIECLSKSDCGVDGFKGENFCSQNNVTRNYANYTCNNAGTVQSYCSNITSVKVIEQCSDICLEGECKDIECKNDLECNDNNPKTKDVCLNPGTINSLCTHTNITCSTNAECNDNNPKTQDKCVNPGETNSYCENNQISCSTKSDCGTDGFLETPFCSGKDVFQKYINYTCNNAGTSQSYCSNVTTNKLKQTCSDSCSNGACIQIHCKNDLECNDNNPRTVDQCVNAGSPQSYCRNTEVNCVNNLDCGFTGFIGENFCSNNNIFKNYQTAVCINGGTPNSRCNIEIIPKLVQDCNDNNPLTQDMCTLDGQIPSCTHTNTNILCRSDNDCGVDGYVGNNFCSNNDVFRNYVDYSCVNPGTSQSYCSNVTTNKLVQDCLSTCSNGQCDNVQCQKNNECNDNNPLTQDICVNPGTSQSYCRNDQIECLSKSDCGVDGYVGNNFCSNNDVKRSYITYTCNNAGTSQSYCSSSTENRLIQSCVNGCSNGQCTTPNIECSNNNECNDNNPLTQDICVNPGTSQSYCRNDQIECLSKSDCGVDGYVGNNFCSNNDVKRSYITYTCNNAGTSQSYCSSSTENRLIQSCVNGCSNGQCTTPNIECSNNNDCNDNNPRTVDQCVNPGTSQSYCRNTEVNCLNNLDCGFTGFIGNSFCWGNDIFKNYQTATCVNPGTLQSYCNVQMNSQKIQICNDNNVGTIDHCSGIPGRDAMCIYEPIGGCRVESDCGVDGYVGENFCSQNNVVKTYVDYTCNNAGTSQSYCSSSTENRLINQCSDICSNGQCVDIECKNDLECDDNNSGTIDKCYNPGTISSYCTNTPVRCSSNLECNDNNAYTQDICVNPGKPNSYCRNDQIECLSKSDCGVDGYVGNNFCSNNDVKRSYITYTCNNAGTSQSYCSSSTENRLIQSCVNGCSNGQCTTQKQSCEDGIDNDGDGLIDIDDPGCENSKDNDETNNFACETYFYDSISGKNKLWYWANNNQFMKVFDHNGKYKYEEKHIICYNNNWYELGPTWNWDKNNGNLTTQDRVIPLCTKLGNWYGDLPDGEWKQGNLPLSCQQQESACEDGIDNDGDGLIDMDDPGCENSKDNDETNAVCVYNPSKKYDCEVTQGSGEVLYWGNNDDWMCNRYDGNFQEKHVLCYNNEWYEADPTWDWNPWNGDFIPLENVIPPCTQIGSWYVDAADGTWKKGTVPSNCPLMAKCKEVDFNCNNVIDKNDAEKITGIANTLADNSLITYDLVLQKKSECSVLGSYMGKLFFRGIDSETAPKMTLKDLNGRLTKINACYSEQIGCIDTDGGKNINSRGQIKDKNGIVLATDKCDSSNTLIEYICGNDVGYTPYLTDGYSLKSITCVNGCSAGKCN